MLPANGVYVTLTLVEGAWRRSITNIGHKPTFGGDPEVTVETHVIDFDRELYGEVIRVDSCTGCGARRSLNRSPRCEHRSKATQAGASILSPARIAP